MHDKGVVLPVRCIFCPPYGRYKLTRSLPIEGHKVVSSKHYVPTLFNIDLFSVQFFRKPEV